MRLIDAVLLKEEINSSLNTGRETFSPEIICDAVDEMPTAFDIDKVVEQIKRKGKHFDCELCRYRDVNNQGCDKDCSDGLLDYLLKIVRGGADGKIDKDIT